jgi:hypothetical protein
VAYTADKPKIAASSEELRQRIPGWGIDLDPANRPSYPKEISANTGARWDFPVRQEPRGFRERSTEHKFLTPVFGTAQPLKGISGQIRKHAYTYSEGRLAHWLLLVAGDRVDVLESRIGALFSGRPDNVITETGVLSEFKNRGYRTRFGQHRVDLKHQPIDLVMWAAPYAAIAGAVYMLMKTPAAQRAPMRRRRRARG